jgi:hypothetical protein
MSIFIENSNTNLIRVKDYTFTKDRMFAIKPVTVGEEDDELEDQTYSNKLFIRQDYSIDPYTPLGVLIRDGIILKNPEPISLSSKKKSKRNKKNRTVKKQPETKQLLYDVYEFYRPLRDDRVYTDGNPDYDDDDAINENDCLKTAECLTIAIQTGDKTLFETLLKASQSPPVLQTVITEKIFAETPKDKDNIKLLKNIKPSEKNNNAAPKMGESYAIVRKKINKNTAYHAAFVIFSHDGVNITIEAEADAGSTYLPKFAFYDTNPEGNTFHRRWSAELYKDSSDEGHQIRYNAMYNNGETIVLKSRALIEIMKELENERLYLLSKPESKRSSAHKTNSSVGDTDAKRGISFATLIPSGLSSNELRRSNRTKKRKIEDTS